MGKLLTTCLLLMVSAQWLWAESIEPETFEPAQGQSLVYGGVRVGYLEVQHVDNGSLNLGFMLGHSFNSMLAIDGSIDYHSPEFDLAGRETVAFQASVYLYPLANVIHIKPYAVGGVGYYLSRYDYEPFMNLDNEHVGDGGFHAGFGVDFPLKKDQGGSKGRNMTIDVRYLFTEESESAAIESDGVLVTLGLKVHF